MTVRINRLVEFPTGSGIGAKIKLGGPFTLSYISGSNDGTGQCIVAYFM